MEGVTALSSEKYEQLLHLQQEIRAVIYDSDLMEECRVLRDQTMENPAVGFTRQVKSGEFDNMPQDDYDRCLSLTNDASDIFHGEPRFHINYFQEMLVLVNRLLAAYDTLENLLVMNRLEKDTAPYREQMKRLMELAEENEEVLDVEFDPFDIEDEYDDDTDSIFDEEDNADSDSGSGSSDGGRMDEDYGECVHMKVADDMGSFEHAATGSAHVDKHGAGKSQYAAEAEAGAYCAKDGTVMTPDPRPVIPENADKLRSERLDLEYWSVEPQDGSYFGF